METIVLGKQAAAAANERKASHIVLFDLSKHSDLTQYMLVCSASSDRQSNAIAEAIETSLKVNLQTRPLAVEGKQAGQWVLLDYGSLIVHIFLAEIRDYYAVEKLWPDAPHVSLKLS